MPISDQEGLFEHAGFKGLRNNVPLDRFGLGDLAEAENVDIDDSERIARKKGFSQLSSTPTKCLWSNGAICLKVENETNLVQVMPDFSQVTIRTDLARGLDMYYVAIGVGRAYYSNGVNNGVVEGGRSRSWGIAIPTGQPSASTTGGVLPPGRYQFAVTFLRRDKQESGTLPAGQIDIGGNGGGVALAAIQVPTDLDITQKIVYFTRCNGKDLFRVGIIDAATTTFGYRIESSGQVKLKTHGLNPPPIGDFVGRVGARLLVAKGNVLYTSEPYAPELFDLRKAKPLQDRITMLESVEHKTDGAWLGTTQSVIWLDGNAPETWGYNVACDYGVIPGTLSYIDGETIDPALKGDHVAFFATTKGLCFGTPSGQFQNMTFDRFAYPVQDRGASIIRRHRGFTQALVCMQGAEQSGNVSF